MECFLPGRLIVGPDPERGDSENLLGELRDITEGALDLDYSFAEILAANDIKLEPQDKSALPFVGRVPEGAEWDISEQLSKHPGVRAALPDFTVRPEAGVVLNQTAIDAALKSIRGEPPGDRCGSGCRIAVLDTGVDAALLPHANISSTQMDARNPGSALLPPSDTDGHGTTVAAIIAATAPGAQIVPVKVIDGSGSISDVLAGLYLARRGSNPCDLINLSLSIDCRSGSCSNCGRRLAGFGQPQLELLFGGALDHFSDVAVIAAGGRSTRQLAAPASFGDIIAVGSFDYAGRRSHSSFPAVPSDRYVMAPAGKQDAGGCFGDTGAAGSSKYLQGTSFAAAFVTGFAARVICNLKGPVCGTPLKQPGGGKPNYFQAIAAELSTRSDRSFRSYDAKLHGLGALRF